MKKIITVFIIVILVLGGVYFGHEAFFKKQSQDKEIQKKENQNQEKDKTENDSDSTREKLSIPKEILNNKFGFLSYSPEEDAETIISYGARWARPHPGPFLWDSMQESNASDISFSKTDEIVEGYQENKIGLLITLWPFANWDQEERGDAKDCRVPDNEEFLPRQDDFGKEESYLPYYRCNPNDWEAYKKWIIAVVERYDGDDKNDMPGLKIPIKYWEVLNEPDLAYFEKDFGEEEESSLIFYKEDPDDYAELLIKTSKAIKAADPGAKVLVAGAAGGSSEFIDFYKDVFGDKKALNALDIANVHCISNDDYESFNVKPYKEFLDGLGVKKSIWVTEAEAMISSDYDINANQTLMSAKNAIEAGAKRIFFTRYNFRTRDGQKMPFKNEGISEIEIKVLGSDPEAVYKEITGK